MHTIPGRKNWKRAHLARLTCWWFGMDRIGDQITVRVPSRKRLCMWTFNRMTLKTGHSRCIRFRSERCGSAFTIVELRMTALSFDRQACRSESWHLGSIGAVARADPENRRASCSWIHIAVTGVEHLGRGYAAASGRRCELPVEPMGGIHYEQAFSLEAISKMLLEASERDFATRRGAGTEHSRVLCEASCNKAWARKTLAQPEGCF